MKMDNRMRNALVVADWTLVLVLFSLLFFRGEGPSQWGVDASRRILSALCFAAGYIGFYIVQWKGRKMPEDEREILLRLKASQYSMVIILIYVFMYCIMLYTFYEGIGIMPSSWLWFLAYSTVCLAYMMNSGIYLLLERGKVGYGQG